MVRLVFLGSDDFSVPILMALLENGPSLPLPTRVAAVVTQPDRPAGRGRKMSTGPVKRIAMQAKIPVLQPERVRRRAARDEIAALQPDALVVASYGQILPQSLLDIPTHGAVNVHPSLLPRYRGPTPIATAILNGDTETGTTLMIVRAEMDAGPIVAQVTTAIESNEIEAELRTRLANLGAYLLVSRMSDWIEGRVQPKEQDHLRATYTRRFTREDGVLDWTSPALELARRVRAFNPWPFATTTWRGDLLRVGRAEPVCGDEEPGRVLGPDGSGLLVGTGNGLLRLLEVQPAGGRLMAARDFAAGRPEIVGAVLGRAR